PPTTCTERSIPVRRMAFIEPAKSGICRAMAYDDGQGVWLFLYNRLEDAPCVKDYWFEGWADAEDWCQDELGIAPSDWKTIPDPSPGRPPHLLERMDNPAPEKQRHRRDFSAFRAEVRRCAEVLGEQGRYIQGESGKIRMEARYRQQVEQICALLIGTKFDVISEMAEWDEATEREWPERAQRVIRWLAEAVEQVDRLVKSLQRAGKGGAADISAGVLVTESAVNILEAFGRVKAARRMKLQDDCSQGSTTEKRGQP
ncbi:MAG: hypothetical protein D6796_10055, partial [Caldilineae bacterium]